MTETIALPTAASPAAPTTAALRRPMYIRPTRPPFHWSHCDVRPCGPAVALELTAEMTGEAAAKFAERAEAVKVERVKVEAEKIDRALAELPQLLEVRRLETATAGYETNLNAREKTAAELRAKVVAAAKTGDLAAEQRKQLNAIADDVKALADVRNVAAADLKVAREKLSAARAAALKQLGNEHGRATAAAEAAVLERLGAAVLPLVAELFAGREVGRTIKVKLLRESTPA